MSDKLDRSLRARAERVLDALDLRIEQQSMRLGADAPHLVALVGTYKQLAGELERRSLWFEFGNVPRVAQALRIMRKVVSTHELLQRARALVLNAKSRATAQSAIRRAREG